MIYIAIWFYVVGSMVSYTFARDNKADALSTLVFTTLWPVLIPTGIPGAIWRLIRGTTK